MTARIDGWYWLSTKRMTVAVLIRDGLVATAPPIVRKFVGQPASNLSHWLKRQPGFEWERIA